MDEWKAAEHHDHLLGQVESSLDKPLSKFRILLRNNRPKFGILNQLVSQESGSFFEIVEDSFEISAWTAGATPAIRKT